MDIEIRVGVPVPPRQSKYKFGSIPVGGSIEIDESADRVGPAACQYGRRNRMQFTVRKLENGKTGVWRLA